MNTVRTLSLTLMMMSLAACAAVGPDYQAPDTAELQAAAFSVDDAVAATAQEPRSEWWRDLNDPVLNTLVERARLSNRDLQAALARVEAAQASLRLERTRLRPQGAVQAAASRRQIAGAAFGQDEVAINDSDLFSASLAGSWELDLFGRVRRLTEAARADARLAMELRRDLEVVVVAETVGAYVDWRGALLRQDVAAQNLAVQAETLRITETRLQEGLGTPLDVARARSQIRVTEAVLPPLELEAAEALNRLATLTATRSEELVQRLKPNARELPTLPGTLAVGDPGTLLLRRPDVRAAEQRLAAATARIGVAKADYLPRIALNADVSLSAATLGTLSNEAARGYGVGPALRWIGFDGPRVRATVRRAGAEADAAFAGFEQTVLLAFEEANTALVALGRETVRQRLLAQAARDAEEAATLARTRYEGGVDDFIDVLDADGRRLAAEQAREDSRVVMLKRYVALYRALGVS